MAKNLFQKIWDDHVVGQLDTGQYQLFIALHLIHEVTSPQAFGMLKDKGLTVAYPKLTFATVDHIIPTDDQARPLADDMAEKMIQVLSDATNEHNIEFFAPQSGSQGIVHVVGPELGLTQPGMTICCGDSHTSTHGAFGCIALGVLLGMLSPFARRMRQGRCVRCGSRTERGQTYCASHLQETVNEYRDNLRDRVH